MSNFENSCVRAEQVDTLHLQSRSMTSVEIGCLFGVSELLFSAVAGCSYTFLVSGDGCLHIPLVHVTKHVP